MRIRVSTQLPLPIIKFWLEVSDLKLFPIADLESRIASYLRKQIDGNFHVSLQVDGFDLLRDSIVEGVIRDGDLVSAKMCNIPGPQRKRRRPGFDGSVSTLSRNGEIKILEVEDGFSGRCIRATGTDGRRSNFGNGIEIPKRQKGEESGNPSLSEDEEVDEGRVLKKLKVNKSERSVPSKSQSPPTERNLESAESSSEESESSDSAAGSELAAQEKSHYTQEYLKEISSSSESSTSSSSISSSDGDDEDEEIQLSPPKVTYIPPGHGKPQTKSRNLRKKKSRLLQKFKSEGMIPKDGSWEDAERLNKNQQDLSSNDVVMEQAHVDPEQRTLIPDIPAITRFISNSIPNSQRFPPPPSRIEITPAAEPVTKDWTFAKEAFRTRQKTRNLRKTKRLETETGELLKTSDSTTSKPTETFTTSKSINFENFSNPVYADRSSAVGDWKSRCSIRAIECGDPNVQVNIPTFPFRRRIATIDEFATTNTFSDELHHSGDQFEDFPPLPSDPTTLRLQAALPKVNSIVVFKHLTMTPQYEPRLSTWKTGRVIRVDEQPGSVMVRLAKRDIPKREYNPETGERILGRFETGEEDLSMEGIEEVVWADIVEARLLEQCE
ncbi:hypothetical protein NEOLI_003385 [Neolecta irregularis DAH-3]|uniref:Coilin n=1 Tax=Neolecta irregularis (strain DAH-3) TaxID=1198029 RepID=A0A1U7LUK3_NEOID|nr:hypothetical protein NEOLI_003385 [Neolecta irregularis DAH-3]|eukprot:OLL26222.1 hypothetical protein NEOLI_003385 [Neolecta irregularis DAH-3]